jgi:hypothetical protein
VLPTHLWFGVGNHFFFFFFFSSKFMSAHSKFQTSPFNFFFLCIWSMSFILLFFIFNNLQNYFRPTSQVAPRPSRLAFWPNLGVKQFNSELTWFDSVKPIGQPMTHLPSLKPGLTFF